MKTIYVVVVFFLCLFTYKLQAQDDSIIDLELSMTVNTTLFIIGDTSNYTIVVSNYGPDVATQVEATFYNTPYTIQITSFTASQGSFNTSTGVWDIGDLDPFEVQVLSIDFIVLPDFQLNAYAQITNALESDIDSTPNNNSFSEDDEDGVLIFDYVILYPCAYYSLETEIVCNEDDTFNIFLTTDLWMPFSYYTVINHVNDTTYLFDYLFDSFGPFPQSDGFHFTVYLTNYNECQLNANSSIVDCNNLSIDLLDFEANSDGENIMLNWSTASEYENDYFLLSQSNDGENFREIALINSIGTSNITNYYKYIHELPTIPHSNIYFQLQSVDYSGVIETYDIQEVDVSKFTSIYSELKNNTINVYCNNKNQELNAQLFSSNGQLVKQTNLNSNNHIKTDGLPSGVYILSVTKNSKLVYTKKWVLSK